MVDVLNVINSLIWLDQSKRATVFGVLMHRLLEEKIKKSQENDIWTMKVNPNELENMIGLSVPNPLVTVENLLEQRKSHAVCDGFQKSFESELTINKGNEQT